MVQPTIDLRSDTVTKPTPAMLAAVAALNPLELGDDVFGEDRLTNAFEAEVAELFGKEAALFVPSGTMANQLAIKIQTEEGDEVICDAGAHLANYETAAPAMLSRVQLRTLQGERGILTAEQIKEAIRPQADWYPRTALVTLENTHNQAGGTIYPLSEIERIAELCKKYHLRLHLDGARLWNACIATGLKPKDYAQYCETISVCFSKGLGAPIGSMLLGSKAAIQKARRYRKMWGGGMRQTGVVVAMAKYALEHHYERMAIDHQHAKMLAAAFCANPKFRLDMRTVETNIVAVDVSPSGLSESEVVVRFKQHGILVSSIKKNFIRLVTHLGISSEDIQSVCNFIQTF
ncbi:MAG: GntG family PLP-dependent aldolase [Chloroherpetonaceae bacterium]|nr:aminotransferase class I/II-fold pyridoxal phosphate-dependent enzyme [Chloroherpetonaceae bacterium]MCS7211859.1 aminotransferase class I/II-fold pyridoxal phosphate-dependent enzyme [Chloroherpetonaceae bacterium]MDW8019619.1 GntG family PLP-dependent aldolase [Chloroherpetonaceae bacterium]MDW8466004.1 GntG family PLP-dependent aldolase [Chloroherpetonaceae bacterium]